MTTNLILSKYITESKNKLIINNIHYLLCVIALWSIIFVYYQFKIFYIITAIAVLASAFFGLLGAIRLDGLLKAMLILSTYFIYLFLTSFWAAYPEIAIYQVLVDSILIFIFGLFFLIGINNSLDRVANIYILAAYPAAVAAIYFSGYDPLNLLLSERVGWLGLKLLPYALPFCIWKIITTDWRKGLLSLLLTLLLIFVSKTRTPILIAAVVIPVSIIALSKKYLASFAFLFKIGFIILVFIAMVSAFETPRSFMSESFDRLRGRTSEVAGQMVSEDWMRSLSYREGLQLLTTVQPLGMGYMNFGPWFAKTFGVETSMHSAFLAWGLEGGIICIFIVFYLLYRFYSILYTMIKKADNEHDKGFYKALMISMLGVLMDGVINQAHQTPTFFVLLGIAYSLPYRSNLLSFK